MLRRLFFNLILLPLFILAMLYTDNALSFDDRTKKNFMGLYEIKQGILAHDRGWFGKNREGFGPDYNFEMMFQSPRFLSKIKSPKPILGLTQTSTGGSSLYYGGLTWGFGFWDNFFLNATTGIAYTNGITKLPKGAEVGGNACSTTNTPCFKDEDKKIQFGSKWLHRGALEIGWNFYGKDTISLMFSHVSHGSMLDEKNQGMDEFGVRYGYRF